MANEIAKIKDYLKSKVDLLMSLDLKLSNSLTPDDIFEIGHRETLGWVKEKLEEDIKFLKGLGYYE